jgi:undecaprenyl-diphosphatase
VESLLRDIIELLISVGPLVVLVVTMAETALFIGLLVPAEATVLVAGFLAYEGVLQLDEVIAATVAGAFLGDQIGYALGRWGGARAAARDGLVGRIWRRHERRATSMFRRRSVFAVTLARFVSFVRTLMPWFAGMSGLPYLRFLFYDLLGVLGWRMSSVGAGCVAGESGRVLANALGAFCALGVALALGAGVATALRRRWVESNDRRRSARGRTKVPPAAISTPPSSPDPEPE